MDNLLFYLVSEKWCPGHVVHYSCIASTRLVWSGTLFNDQCSEERITVETNSSVSCGRLTTSNIIVPDPGFPNLNAIQSTLTFIAKVNTLGATIRCTVPLAVPVDEILTVFSMCILASYNCLHNNSYNIRHFHFVHRCHPH